MTFLHNRALLILRWSLGITFCWFGVLKLFAVSPVQSIMVAALPPVFAESQLFLFLIAFLEILIGIAFFANKAIKLATIVMIGYLLLTTIAVLVTQGFSPRFPVLSLAGEFAVKNLVLMAGGLILITEKEVKEKQKPEAAKSEPR